MARDDPSVDPEAAAEAAGLSYVSDERPGITRRKQGQSFAYFHPDGSRVTDEKTLDRIRALAVPPAYTDVWISRRANGHIQATGRDAKGRKQYRYHARFRETRDSNKYERMLEFAAALPAIRERVDADMRKHGLPREKVLATIVHLLETTMIRVGNADYAKQNKSFGLSTLRNRHVDIDGSEVRFAFKGKSGKAWNVSIRDRRVARIVKSIQELPGQQLFQYLDESGERCEVSSTDINDYLREISGRDITAKDFRTWTGTVLTALALAAAEPVENERGVKARLKEAICDVAAALGNTPTVCRKAYIHPEVIGAFSEHDLGLRIAKGADKKGELRAEEKAVFNLLKRRLKAAK
ncbi:DNA topoisomerase IB [Sphingoaurantiacus capsulatus]|uniref:DNA topoisomerase n=1 Tax=Sphingoaurantiacus capsulatus TaxID=1771310 RepID=A0ABV7XG77_9SPHN